VHAFTYQSLPSRVVFGAGTLACARDEVERLGGRRVLLLAAASGAGGAARLAAVLGDLVVARFDGAAAHTPIEVTERALALLAEHRADCVVALGGGTTTGLAKALAVRTGVPQVVLPTTYAGSEVTPVLGETADGRKTTRSSPDILPETVVYDVELTLGLPQAVSLTSGVNALAHAVEALYAPQANPAVDALALEAIARLGRSLPRVVQAPADREARADVLAAAWLAGTCLAAGGMGLHHHLCHLLGGSFGLPHAATHAVVLPHVLAYNAPAAPGVLARVAAALGAPDAPRAVFDLVARLGGPTALRDLGMAGADLPRAVDLALAAPYPNPRELTADGVAALLDAAHAGRRPAPRPEPGRGGQPRGRR